ncbi:MAG: hypothetical protein ABI661_09210 [Gammaproteobacteria bacterium]
MSRPTVKCIVLIALSVAWSGATLAADPWLRYENAHFVGYSDATEKRARALLAELETFRAAFLQVGNITTPPDSPKAVILITATKNDFQRVARNRLIGGFATSDGTTPLIVLPAQGDTEFAQAVIRHEYGHTLLRYKRFAYPAWYNEGFAELVSAVEVSADGQSFRLGRAPVRLKSSGPPIFDWRELLSDGFNPHELKDRRSGSSAYSQAWLLAHYATLGNDLKNAPKLQAYFDRLTAGEPSESAFEAAFGVKIAELWETTLKPYMKHMPFYTFRFRPTDLDSQFAATAPDATEVPNLMRWFEIREALTDEPSKQSFPPATLVGRWATLRLGLRCEDPLTIAVAGGDGELRVTFPLKQAANVSAGMPYRYSVRQDGLISLESSLEDAVDLALYIKRPGPDLVCVGRSPADATLCRSPLFRCGD